MNHLFSVLSRVGGTRDENNGLGLVIEFIDHLQVVTTNKCSNIIRITVIITQSLQCLLTLVVTR
jgi:hypothetical protein